MAPRLLKRIVQLAEHAPSLIDRMGLARVKVFIKVVPLVVVALAVRITLEMTVEGFDGIFDAASVSPFATASMFVIAIILGGVLEDVRGGGVGLRGTGRLATGYTVAEFSCLHVGGCARACTLPHVHGGAEATATTPNQSGRDALAGRTCTRGVFN